MLGVRDLRKVAWRRSHARRHYLGYITLSEDTIRLAGRETETGIDVSLSIPYAAVRLVRLGKGSAEEVVGEAAVVLDVADDEPILLRPVGTGPLDLAALARRISTARGDAMKRDPQRPARRRYSASKPSRIA